MRRRRKRKVTRMRPSRIVAMMIVIPLLSWVVWNGAVLLGRAGEGAAVLSAAILMPEGSAPILRERFRAEIYNPDGEHATGEGEQGVPLTQQEPIQPQEPDNEAQTPNTAEPGETGPRIAEEYAAPIINEDFSGSESELNLRYGAGLIKNDTNYSQQDIADILKTQWPVQFSDGDDPQVLIVHTHATEAFEKYDSAQYDVRNTWRSTDNRNNMVAVGDAMAQTLEARGIGVLHDTTQHDYPSYNGSYERSAETIQGYLEEYPTIKVVLDLHRDAMQRGDAIVKPVAIIDGKKAAQIMIISACDDGGDVPEWRENLRFAAQLQDYMEQSAPGLTRPVFLCYRQYNMDLTTGSLLLEFGSNANTLDEAVYSARLAGEALADLIQDNTVDIEGIIYNESEQTE